jgi:hypothetical protein
LNAVPLTKKDTLLLGGLTFGALCIHGYHPGVEDAEIYLPGVLKILHPSLFPFNADFFEAHAHLTFFPNLIAASARITHIPLDFVLFLWHILSIFLLLLACLKLSRLCFPSTGAQWAGVVLVAAILTIPVAGTRLYIMDQYLNPRSISISCAVFAIEGVLRRSYFFPALWIAFAAAIHPLMAVFTLSFVALLVLQGIPQLNLGMAALLPLGISFAPPSAAYHESALTHTYHYLTKWAWYEWLGVFAPLAGLWWINRMARAKGRTALEVLSRSLIFFSLFYLPWGLALSIPVRFESLARFQPMRSLHLLYVLFLLFVGCILGESLLKKRVWAWIVFFVPVCAGMFYVQRQLFPATPHLEWPWAAPKNEWAKAFAWIRSNTPEDALFALDPHHMEIAGEDEHGFRALAERSMLADAVKDSGAVSMFPGLAETWLEQVRAQSDWKSFGKADFQRLQEQYGVSWNVVQQPGVTGLECPYENQAVRVCRIYPDARKN